MQKIYGAKYFLIMFKVLANADFSIDEILLIFKDLFDRKQLTNCKRVIINVKCAWTNSKDDLKK